MLIQKFHPSMRLGQQPVVAVSGNPLFSRQGHWDGGSTLHCVVMALALLGKLTDRSTCRITHAAPNRSFGMTRGRIT
ncbi:hypothetical protein [Burkholderia gladioli]|uniref:hypothetical protein n=1 Tax=Burkholderia gladioli TaxID=28095 RepID=UPI0031333398